MQGGALALAIFNVGSLRLGSGRSRTVDVLPHPGSREGTVLCLAVAGERPLLRRMQHVQATHQTIRGVVNLDLVRMHDPLTRADKTLLATRPGTISRMRDRLRE